MYKIDLNSDLGESFGRYTLGMDNRIIPLISSANVACGYHASDPVVMEKTVAMAKEAGIGIGAHPGYPDLMGFGRRNLDVTPAEARAYTLYQLGALDGFCRANGVKMQHVKPHGALYNMAGKDYALAKGICEAIASFDKELIVMALSGSELVRAAEDMGLRVAREVFADRAYEEDGSLVNRRKEGAMVTDENLAISRVVRMILEQKGHRHYGEGYSHPGGLGLRPWRRGEGTGLCGENSGGADRPGNSDLPPVGNCIKIPLEQRNLLQGRDLRQGTVPGAYFLRKGESRMDSDRKSVLMLHAAVMLFGLSAVLGRWISVPAVCVAGGRVVCSTLVLLILCRWKKISTG